MSHYSSEYKEKVFLDWFNKGQQGYITYHRILPVDEVTNSTPSLQTIQLWISEDFRPRAEELNKAVTLELEGRLVKEKVEMLHRHAIIGHKITDKALDYLDKNEFTTAGQALRALVEGIRIERESRGLPEALEKMAKADDETLLSDVKKLLEKGSVTIEPND